MIDDFILGLQALRATGAVSLYATHEMLVIYGADITAGVEDYGFYWDEKEEAWVYYT